MRKKKIFSKILAITLAVSMVPVNAFAETGGSAPAADTSSTSDPGADTSTAAEKLEAAAKNAEDAAKKAEDALNYITAKEDDINNKSQAVTDAKAEADTVLNAALDTRENADDEVSKAIENIEKSGSDDEKQTAINEAVDQVNKVIEEANKAVDSANEVVDKANELIIVAEEVAAQANTAVEQANTALEHAEKAEELYKELLQEAVNGDPETYKALAEAENEMTRAWNKYAEKQNQADQLTAQAQKLEIEADKTKEEAKEQVEKAYNEAKAAQDIAKTLYDAWVEAETNMQKALTATGDQDLAALEAHRKSAREAALEAQENARKATEKAVEVYEKARQAAGIANEAIDHIDEADWQEQSLIEAVEAAVEKIKGTPLLDERDWSKLNDKKDKPGMAGKSYAVSFGKFSPGSQRRKSDDSMNPGENSISGYLPGTENLNEKKAHSFLRLFNGDNRQESVGYNVNMPLASDLDYVMFQLNDGSWFVWSNTKTTDIENFATVKKFSSLTADKNAGQYNFNGYGSDNAMVVTELVTTTINRKPVELTYTTKYWIEKSDRGYEIHFESLMVQNQREAPKGAPGYQMDCVLGEERIKRLYFIYGDPAAPVDFEAEISSEIGETKRTNTLGSPELPQTKGLSVNETGIEIPTPEDPGDQENPGKDPGENPGPDQSAEVPDNNVPRGSGSRESITPAPPTVIIEDAQTPLAGDIAGYSIIIPDSLVPLAGLPKTGDSTSFISGFMAAVSGFMSLTAGLFLLLNKRKRRNFSS